MLRKKRAKEGKTSDEVEHFPVPSTVTIRQRSTVSIDMKESEVFIYSFIIIIIIIDLFFVNGNFFIWYV